MSSILLTISIVDCSRSVSLPEFHLRPRTVVRVLHPPDVHPVCPYCRTLMGVILDKHRCSTSKDFTRYQRYYDIPDTLFCIIMN